MQFHGGLVPEKFQLDQHQNGRLSAITDFNKRDIWEAVPDSWTITIKHYVRFREGYDLKNGYSIKFKIANLRPLLTLIWPGMFESGGPKGKGCVGSSPRRKKLIVLKFSA